MLPALGTNQQHVERAEHQDHPEEGVTRRRSSGFVEGSRNAYAASPARSSPGSDLHQPEEAVSPASGGLSGAACGPPAEVGEGRRGGHPAPGGALEEPFLQEVGLVDVLDRLGLLPDRHRQRRQADGRRRRTYGTGRIEDGPVDLVEAPLVDLEQREGVPGARRRSRRRRPGTSAKSRTSRSRRLAMRGVPRARTAISAAPSGSRPTPEDAGGPARRWPQVGGVVVVEPGHEPEPVPQRPGDEAGAGGGARPG